MKTAFDSKQLRWTNDTVDRLPKHDIVFATPINNQLGGLPLGDGSMGSLLWMDKQEVRVHFNHTDIWQDSTDENPVYCSREEENVTCTRHGGEITVRFKDPVFDMFYQDTYDSRLSLEEATATVHADTPFGDIQLTAFAESRSHVSVIRGDFELAEAEEVEINLSRFGSRNFWRWYERLKHAPAIGLDGTQAHVDGNRLYITQELNATKFCLGLEVVSLGAFSTRLDNSHSCTVILEAAREHHFDIFYTIAIGEDVADARCKCAKALDQAVEQGMYALLTQHKQDWASFWNRSLVCIPHDYLENIYYFSMYVAQSQCRGKYPPHFTNGVWGFRHDFVPWTYYFYYNMQHMYAPLSAAGHSDLLIPFFDLRRRGLDVARHFAKEDKGLDGAFYHDVTDRYGRGANYHGENHTPGAQTAITMWRHYRFTGDEKFLKETAMPIMEAVTDMYLSLVEKEEDGLYHVNGTSAYEGNPVTRDTITDMAMIRVLFGIMKDVADDERRAKCKEVLDHLADFIYVPMEEEDWDGERLSFGGGKGRLATGDKVLSFGYDKDGKPLRRSYGDPDCEKIKQGGFHDVEMSPIYPSGLVGLADQGTKLFDALTNQILIHDFDNGCLGHYCMLGMFLGRMGQADVLWEYLPRYVGRCQLCPNGFNTDGPGPTLAWQQTLTYNYGAPYDPDHSKRSRLIIESSPFRYFNGEHQPVIAQAINEALFQSYDGILRVCPAIRPADPVSFRLFGEGGFAVQAQVDEDDYVITVESFRGETCLLKLPVYADQSRLHAYVIDNGKATAFVPTIVQRGPETVIDLSEVLKAGQTALLCSAPIEQLETETPARTAHNDNWKRCDQAMLGSPLLPHYSMEREENISDIWPKLS